MASDPKTTLRCVGCERAAPASAKPEPCGNWLCRKCLADTKWAMDWLSRIMKPARGPLINLMEPATWLNSPK